MSRATRVPLQTLHGWLHGSEPKNLRQVKAVADYLEVDLDYLCFGIKPAIKTKGPIEDFREEINAGILKLF